MKKIIVLMMLILPLCSTAIEYVKVYGVFSQSTGLNASAPIHFLEILSGQTAEVAGISKNSSTHAVGDVYVNYSKDATTDDWILIYHDPSTPMNHVIEGPATLKVSQGDSNWAIIKIATTEPLVAPYGTVVIPSDDGGPVNIILESSTDLINWTTTLPGTYGTTESKRFFRIRATR